MSPGRLELLANGGEDDIYHIGVYSAMSWISLKCKVRVIDEEARRMPALVIELDMSPKGGSGSAQSLKEIKEVLQISNLSQENEGC